MDEPTSSESVSGERVTLDRELHPFEARELATVIEAVKLHVLRGWPRWWAWAFASMVAQIAIGIKQRLVFMTRYSQTRFHAMGNTPLSSA